MHHGRKKKCRNYWLNHLYGEVLNAKKEKKNQKQKKPLMPVA